MRVLTSLLDEGATEGPTVEAWAFTAQARVADLLKVMKGNHEKVEP